MRVCAFFSVIFVCDRAIRRMCAHVCVSLSVCVHCCFYVLAPVCPKLFPNLIITFFFTKLHISPQAILDSHKVMVVLRIWDMTVCD